MANEREFTLVGKFDDQITKKLKAINEELSKLSKPLKKDNVASSLTKGFEDASKELKNLQKSLNSVMSSASSDASKVTKSFTSMTGSLDDAAKSAGKVRDTVSQIGEGVKGLDSIGESLEAAARAAGRAQEEVAGIGNAAGRANGQAESLINTLLKAEALSKIGDGVAAGFSNGMARATNIAARGAGLIGKMFRESMEDELADVKAATGIQGSFGRAGYKGTFSDAQRTYKAFDREVSEMIKMSSAPTAKVIELQRYTLDTIGPLLMAAEGVQKGTAMKDIKPEAIQNAAKGYGALLEKVAILGQGTGSAGFRIASGIEQLVTRGKIDTQLDFFTDNILLMQNLQDAGFMGRQGTGGGKLMGATDAERLTAMMEAFEKSMSGEATAAMATSLTGSMQALGDVITNPSAGILGMSVSFGKDTQKKVNATVREIYAGRIAEYQHELKTTKNLSAERRKQLEISIQQAIKTRDQLTKEGEERITTPFQAFSFSFSKVVQALTDALNSVGPVWENFAVVAIEFSENALGPLADNLKAIASNMRAGKMGQAEGFGRIVGEIYKKIGEVMGDLATMLTSPTGAAAKVQSEFMKGFMSAFGENPEQLKKAREAINRGISALAWKIVEMLKSVIMSEELRPFVLLFFGVIFGPAMISAVIAGVVPLAIMGMGGLLKAIFAKLGAAVSGTPTPAGGGAGGGGAAAAAGGGRGRYGVGGSIDRLNRLRRYRIARGASEAGELAREVASLGYELAGTPGKGGLATAARGFRGVGKAISRLGRAVPGGAIAMGAVDVATGLASGQPLEQVVGSTVGSVLGAMVGTVFGPVGTVIGGVAGGYIGEKVGGYFSKPAAEHARAAQLQLQASLQQKQAAGMRTSGIDTGGQSVFLYGKASELSKRFSELGLSANPLARSFESLYRLNEEKQNQAAKAAAELNKAISENIALGHSTRETARLVKPLQEIYNRAKTDAESSLKGLNVAWGKLPASTTAAIVQSFKTMPVGAVEAAIAQRILRERSGRTPGERSSVYSPGSIRIPSTPSVSASPTRTYRGGQRSSSGGSGAFGSDNLFMGTLGEAINFEMKHKPAGSHLVIANSSETIIPAAGGLGDGMRGVITAIWGAAQQSSNSISRDLEKSTYTTVSHIGKGIERMSSQTSSTFARGFTSMQSSFRSGQAETTRAIERSLSITSRQNQQLLSAIKAAAAAGGFGGMGGMGLGGGYGSAGVRLAGMLGNFIKATGGAPGSIWEHPWHGGVRGTHSKDSYHYSGRAIDIGAYAYEQGGVISRVHQFNRKMGVRPVEFLHAGNDKGHQDHVHVAYAYGPKKPALFKRQEDAIAWERDNIPAHLKVMSVTTNSGETMGPGEEVLNKLSKIAKVMSAVGGNLCALMGTNRSGADTAGSFTGDKAGLNQLMNIAKGAGFTGRAAEIMAAIAMAESGGNPRAHNRKPPDNSYGLWQINMHGRLGPERQRQFGLRSYNDLFDPAINARAAFAISGGGVNFRPWSVYNNGAYKKFLPTLEHVAYALGPSQPAFLPSRAAAEAWERKVIPSQFKVKTLTTNTGEMAMGGSTTINAPITIYQQPNQDPEELASIVTYRIGLAFNELRNHA